MNEASVFQDEVELKYQLYNSLFLTLPFSHLSQYGAQLPLFSQLCEEKLSAGMKPTAILDDFIEKIGPLSSERERDDLIFLFLQLIERQVLLFDAVESAAHQKLYGEKSEELRMRLCEGHTPGRSLRLVLTAHPTQFYPDFLLGIIKDLSKAVGENNMGKVRKLLLQLGRTPFKSPQQPTPLAEAQALIEQFGRTFYNVFLELTLEWKKQGKEAPSLELGFWPGGDRDGHPLVTVETTKEVARLLREFALARLIELVEQLRCRITFKGTTELVAAIRKRLQESLREINGYHSPKELQDDLLELLELVKEQHGGLFSEEIDKVLAAIEIFGFHFASLDIRQSSDVHERALDKVSRVGGEGYLALEEEEKWEWLVRELTKEEAPDLTHVELDPVTKDLFDVLAHISKIQEMNGEKGLHRFVISHTEKARHLLEILLLFHWQKCESVDIVPLFESIEDLKAAPEILRKLLRCPHYRRHLEKRGGCQTVMLGFSDGTKDGGYATCNWEIQNCKQRLHALAEEECIRMIFFDGRGGPPARGGGYTHKYYAAIAKEFHLHDIQLTIQGQSISSFYGTTASASYNTLQLLAAFLEKGKAKKRAEDEELLQELSQRAHVHYQALRSDPLFLPLLAESTPLTLLGELNIASRPQKRSEKSEFSLENLRAISFVGSWSLMKLNVPAYYGMGFALEEMIQDGKEQDLKTLYRHSSFFETLIDNAAQALRKSFLDLTLYLEEDMEYGRLWSKIRNETLRCQKLVLQLTGRCTLIEEGSITERSVAMREHMILPLLVIQHDALMRWRLDPTDESAKKRLLKSIPPSINASRNSA